MTEKLTKKFAELSQERVPYEGLIGITEALAPARDLTYSASERDLAELKRRMLFAQSIDI